MWNSELKKVVDILKRYNKEINIGCSSNDLECLGKKWRVEMHSKLPKDYLSVISQLNGIDFNGFVLYGFNTGSTKEELPQRVYDIIDMNKEWYKNKYNEEYIFLGESNTSWYVYKIDDGTFLELDSPSAEIMERFSTFEEMFKFFLGKSIL